MVFKKMLRAFGVGGPSVDTVLADPHCRPGGVLAGEVRMLGGDHDVEIEHVALSLVTRIEVEAGDHEGHATVEFQRAVLGGRTRLAAGQQLTLPFQFGLPWETPVTAVYGQHLHGMGLGVRTELSVANAIDKGDLDPITVHPLPSQQRVLDAFGQLGFRFIRADLEHGRLHGVPQQLPFFQEVEYYPPQQFAGRLNEVELTFVADPHNLYIVLEADKRAGLLRAGGDAFGRFQMSHHEAEKADWAAMINSWLEQVIGRRPSGGHGAYGAPAPGGYVAPAPGAYGAPGGYQQPGQYQAPGGYQSGGHQQPGYGQPGHHGPHGHLGGHHRGMGMGGVAAGAAAGVAGGMIMGEAFDEVGDFFEGEE
ncbi:MAG TPA: sporulation protein [Pseudonocardiaceae bacterium]